MTGLKYKNIWLQIDEVDYIKSKKIALTKRQIDTLITILLTINAFLITFSISLCTDYY